MSDLEKSKYMAQLKSYAETILHLQPHDLMGAVCVVDAMQQDVCMKIAYSVLKG